MGSPNSDYMSTSSGDATPELYDAAELLEDENEAKGAESESDDERLNSSPPNPFPSGFRSHWTHSWSGKAEICRSPQKSECSPRLENESAAGPAEQSVAEVNPCISNWPYQNNSKHPVVGAGMENLGNTCFLNSVLQCFIHTVPLLHGILSNGQLMHSNCNKEGFCLLCALGELTVCSFTNNVVAPWNFVDNLSYFLSSFRRFQQEDAHEFLQCFLDRLEICHDSESKGCGSPQSDNIVKQVFGGRLVSNLKCCNCGYSSDTYEPSIDMSLEIEDADNLETALQSFTKVETIEDPDTKFTCENCKEKVSVEKKLSFDEAPSVAVFHLKRFKNDDGFVQKIDKHVAFPLDLDLLPFAGSGKNNDGELTYVLYAIVVHSGWTSSSGHYYCFIRLSSNMWCKFDDSRVVLVDEDIVLSQEAYVLFYAKEKTPWFLSFIESQKEFVHSSLWNTSPKSVLDNMDSPSVSPKLQKKFCCDPNELSHVFGSVHSEADDNEIKPSSLVQNKIESNESTYNLHRNSGSVAPSTINSSDASSPIAQKISSTLLENISQKQKVFDAANCPNDTQTALRSPSPEIYREDPPEVVYSNPRNHLRLVDRSSCKRRLEKDMDDPQHKQACSFIKKTMPSSRGQQLLAAIRGPINEASSSSKKSRRLGNDSSASRHDSSVRRSLRPLVAGSNR